MFSKTIFCLFLAVAAAGCTANPELQPVELQLEGSFELKNIKNSNVYELRIHEGLLFAGTSNGLVSLTLNDEMNVTGRYMAKGHILTFLILEDNYWLISATFGEADYTKNDNIYKSNDQGKSWIVYGNGFGGKTFEIPVSMAASSRYPTEVYARSSYSYIAKSNNAGTTWNEILGNWNELSKANSEFIKIDTRHSDIIWSGGADSLSRAQLFKSESRGRQWDKFLVTEAINATVYDVITHPDNSDKLLAACGSFKSAGNVIRKSIDGGETWQTVLSDTFTKTLVYSQRNSRIIYASGINLNGVLFFAASGNFGETWEIVEMKNSPPEMVVNDMISVMNDGQETLYFGTNKGVYSYTFENKIIQ